MIKPALFDLVEVVVDIPKDEMPEPEMPGVELGIGLQGYIVEIFGDHEAYMVEFLDEEGHTTHLTTLYAEMVTVVWQREAKKDVPIAEQIANLVARLPESTSQGILDFARFQYARTVPFRSAEWSDGSSAAAQQNQPEHELVAAD